MTKGEFLDVRKRLYVVNTPLHRSSDPLKVGQKVAALFRCSSQIGTANTSSTKRYENPQYPFQTEELQWR